MPRRASSASSNGATQTSLGETPNTSGAGATPANTEARKPKVRKSADEEIALHKARLDAALDRKFFEEVEDLITLQGGDKRILGAIRALRRIRPWLTAETYKAVHAEIQNAVATNRSPVGVLPDDDDSENDDDNEVQ